MNKVLLIGRMTKDPVIRHSQNENQTCVAIFTLAVDRRFKREGSPSADFISCKAFGKTAEVIERFGRKGLKIAAEGRIETGSYQGNDGKTVYTTDVMVEFIEFVESKNAGVHTDNSNDGFTDIPKGAPDPFSQNPFQQPPDFNQDLNWK